MNPSPYYGNKSNPYGQATISPQNSGRETTNIANQALQAAAMARTNNFNRNTETVQAQYNFDAMNKGHGDLYESGRASFVRKVYGILSIQLIITALICVWAVKSQTFKTIFVNVPAIIILSVLLLVFSIVIGCFLSTTRKYGLPIVIIFTLIFALLVGIICAKTKPQIVLTAAGITAVIVVALTIFACVTKTDLTGCAPYLIVLSLVLIIFGIVCIFWRNPIAHLIYACLTALLFGIYLIFDTQLVLGKFQNSYSFDDAYFAAIQLYIDIIEIFLQVLRILSYVNN